MRIVNGKVLSVASMLLTISAGAALAGPGFAYSWLSTDRTFDQCIAAANDVASGLNYPRVERTRFGITGENDGETIFVSCEDLRHVSVILMRSARPKVGEIDALVALLQQRLGETAQ